VNRWSGLIGRLARTLDDLDGLAARAARQLQMARQTGDDAFLDAVALNLQGFYTGAEQAWEAIAVDVDGGLPQGANWHRELLRQVSAPLVGVRPAVLHDGTFQMMDELRRFRHVVRNVYSQNLDAARVSELGNDLPRCASMLRRDTEAFLSFLREAGDDVE
jgi:hypothetical protein